jgi:hypothetical protein
VQSPDAWDSNQEGNNMNINTLKDHLAATALAISFVFFAGTTIDVAQAVTITKTESDIAVIDIPHPKEGNLLMLRGLVGSGTATFRINNACRTMPVRFVAGDFSGQHVDVGRTGSIRIVVNSAKVMHDLLAGRDLVSDAVRVSSDSSEKDADLYLARGLSAKTGFVINPGRSVLADLMGARTADVACTDLSTTFQ